MKKSLFVLFLIPLFSAAQKKEIKPVKMHTVEPKESFSSIGRLYEVNGRVLAIYNNTDYDKGISIGQVLKIPPKGTSIDQVSNPQKADEPKIQPPVLVTVTNDETGTPVYHKVGKKETLFHIATLYPGITIGDLKKWNNLTGDGVNEGVSLVVGYEKPAAGNKKPVPVKTEKEKPVVTEVIKKEPDTKEPEKIKEPEKKELPKAEISGKAIKGGAFKSLYESQNGSGSVINEEGSFGVFKSTSGWTDGKYYCLYNNAGTGTIIKISIPSTGRFVYAKVLDAMPDLKQNAGLLILISNAAASELGVAETAAGCSISYSK